MPSQPVYDPLDPITLDNPYPTLAGLRDTTPVFWHEELQSWCLTRHADCVAVLRDHERFARDRRRVGTVVPEPSLSVQSLDPPEQAGVRSLFMNALRAHDLVTLENRARQRVMSLFSRLSRRHEFDVMRDVAAPLSVAVISDLLGVEEPDIESFAAVSDTIMRSMDAGLDPATVEPGRAARQQLNTLVESWFHDHGRDGLLSHVRQYTGQTAGTYVRNTARVMFQGGYSTMTAAIGNVVHTLLQHPDALARMRDPAVLRTGVDELVRFDGPVQGTSRFATVPTTVGGKTIRPGETVLALFAAANHDPAQFPQPDQLWLGRSPNHHLGYGWGTHACLGTVAARTALRALVSSLLEQPTPLRTAGPPQRRRTATMRVFDVVPATFHP